MNKLKFGVAAVYGLVLFLFFLFTQLGYQPISSASMSNFVEYFIFIGLIIIMGFQAAD